MIWLKNDSAVCCICEINYYDMGKDDDAAYMKTVMRVGNSFQDSRVIKFFTYV